MTQSNKSAWNDTLMNTYGTPPVTLVSGKGAHATGKDGTDYIDLLAGIAVNSLGHAHPAIVESVARTFAGWDGADAAEDRSVTRFRVWHAAARADINEGMAA